MSSSRRNFIRSSAILTSLTGLVPVIGYTTPGSLLLDKKENMDEEKLIGDAEKIIEGVKYGKDATVKELLSKSPALQFLKDYRDRSLIWIAAMYNQSKLFPLLQANGYRADMFDICAMGDANAINEYAKKNALSLNATNKAGYTPMLCSAECGQGVSVETLVGIGGWIDTRLPGTGDWTPLLLALKHTDDEAASWMVQILLGNGANPDLALEDGTTPLHLAAAGGHEFAVQLLLRKRANITLKNKMGETPSDLARKNNQNSIAQMIDNYPDSKKDFYVTRYLRKSGEKVNREDTYGIPVSLVNEFVVAAHFSIENTKKFLSLIPDLLLTRASWDEIGVEGCTHVGNELLVNYLLEKGSPMSICTASMLGETGMVKKILKENPQTITDRGPHDFPLIWYAAIGKQKIDIAEILISAGADVNANVRGRSALSECAGRGHSELAEMFIQKGADVNMKSKSVFLTGTPLEIAIKRKQDKMAELFRKYGGK